MFADGDDPTPVGRDCNVICLKELSRPYVSLLDCRFEIEFRNQLLWKTWISIVARALIIHRWILPADSHGTFVQAIKLTLLEFVMATGSQYETHVEIHESENVKDASRVSSSYIQGRIHSEQKCRLDAVYAYAL